MVVCLERGADLHMAQLMPLSLTVSCSSKIQIGFTFSYRLTWVFPWNVSVSCWFGVSVDVAGVEVESAMAELTAAGCECFKTSLGSVGVTAQLQFIHTSPPP